MIFRNKFNFPKIFRLHSEKEISFLFQQNNSFLVFPIKVLFARVSGRNVPLSILITVPKVRVKKAVHRNHIKRLIKEAFRQNNSSLYSKLESTTQQIVFSMIYVHNIPLSYKQIEKSVVAVLQEIEARL
jgi:ribonuclease P protein component